MARTMHGFMSCFVELISYRNLKKATNVCYGVWRGGVIWRLKMKLDSDLGAGNASWAQQATNRALRHPLGAHAKPRTLHKKPQFFVHYEIMDSECQEHSDTHREMRRPSNNR
jgi:hypothetical protein